MEFWDGRPMEMGVMIMIRGQHGLAVVGLASCTSARETT